MSRLDLHRLTVCHKFQTHTAAIKKLGDLETGTRDDGRERKLGNERAAREDPQSSLTQEPDCSITAEEGKEVAAADIVPGAQAAREAAPKMPADTGTQEGLKKLVEKFFSENFRDVTSRKTMEWGQREVKENGNVSIRYMYEAAIRDKDKSIMNQVFTFTPKGEYVSYENVKGYPKEPSE